MEDHHDDDEEDTRACLVVVSETDWWVGRMVVCVHVSWMCDTMGWWPEGAEDHVSSADIGVHLRPVT